MHNPRVSIVAAMGAGRVIGRDNTLLWHIPDDMRRFKALTLGHPIIMGRKTFDSILEILGKPLPGRTNIVVTRDIAWEHPGATVAHSLDEALEQARALDTEEIFIGGGTQIYEQALPFTDRLYLTFIDDTKEGDTHFPPFEHLFTKKITEETRAWDNLEYAWVTLERQ